MTYTTKHIDVPIEVSAVHHHEARDKEDYEWKHGEYHWDEKTGLFEYAPVSKEHEMPETVEHESHRHHFEPEPVFVGGKTKYPMFNPPPTPPVKQ